MRTKSILIGIIFLVMLTLIFISARGGSESKIMRALPRAPREFRGVWVATVANIDWPSRKGLSTDRQKAELIAILDKAVELNLNAIIFQVRPMCDALYASKYEPWSAFLTGQMGKPPQPYYDPLEFIIKEAHKRGLEVHAWFNPYRAHHPADKSPIAPNHISKTHPELVKKYGRYLWLDPGEKAVQDHSINVIMDVVKRYDVDGVHLDDYFYPYKERDKNGNIIEFPDDASWNKYKASGGKLSRADWRRDNVNKFIERLYKSVKAEKPWVKVGISPFGIWRPGYPEGVTGLDQYEELYADARLWLQKGWVDYFTPQLYWKISSSGQPYKDLLKWWVEQNKKGRHIWPGNFTSKWSASEIVNQVKATREQKGATGNVHFSMKAFLQNRGGICQKIKESVYNQPALVPACPWLDNKKPGKPTVDVRHKQNGDVVLSATPAPGSEVSKWVYYSKKDNNWGIKIIPAEKNNPLVMTIPGSSVPDEVAVTTVTRLGNESNYALLRLK